ncbi:MAG: CPBP family intramembrane metalloprotease [Verrucomicrobia bacterium]|nr:CPBP family intramembrane metalloprotease [Verrucomicrobiota bacterium]
MEVLGSAVFVLLVGASFAIFSRLGRRIYLLRSGTVKVEQFGGLDAFFVLSIVLYIGMNGWRSANSASARLLDSLDPGQLTFGILMYWSLVIGPILFSMIARDISVPQAFGLNRLNLVKILTWGLGLLIAALPLIAATSVLVSALMKVSPENDTQEIVKIFEHLSDPIKRIPLIFLAVVVAPLAEEFVFRGYIYGVLKKYFGPIASLVFTSTLFAVIHLHIPSLLPLFVLACVLTLSYELSGSLLVPMTMHALFNAITLVGVALGLK